MGQEDGVLPQIDYLSNVPSNFMEMSKDVEKLLSRMVRDNGIVYGNGEIIENV